MSPSRELVLYARRKQLQLPSLARQIAQTGMPATTSRNDLAPSSMDRNADDGRFRYRAEAEFERAYEQWIKVQAKKFYELLRRADREEKRAEIESTGWNAPAVSYFRPRAEVGLTAAHFRPFRSDLSEFMVE